jgi:ADP-ribosylglycohydrolase
LARPATTTSCNPRSGSAKTPTTAAIAGGIAGLRFGAAAIPHRWRQALRAATIPAELLGRLHAQ